MRLKFVPSVCNVAVCVVLLTLAASTASADIFTSALNNPNAALSGQGPNFGTVTVNLTGQVATITFSANAGFLLGGQGTAGVNLNTGSFTLGPITGTRLPGFSTGAYSNGGANTEDGFGSFNQTIDTFDGYTNGSTSVMFTITNTGTPWASAANVLIANSSGFDAAAHIFVCDATPCSPTGAAIVTGFAAEIGGSTAVPEPTSMLLLGTLVGLTGLGMRKLRKA